MYSPRISTDYQMTFTLTFSAFKRIKIVFEEHSGAFDLKNSVCICILTFLLKRARS